MVGVGRSKESWSPPLVGGADKGGFPYRHKAHWRFVRSWHSGFSRDGGGYQGTECGAGRAGYEDAGASGARGRLLASVRRAPVWSVQRYGRDTYGAETPLATRGTE